MVCEVNCPYSCACAEIEDTLGVWVYGREEEGAIEGEIEDMMEEIEVVLCGFVVGAPVYALSIAVVSAAILVDILRYC